MSTIPGVTATTTVVNNTPKGNAISIGCFIGGADAGLVQTVYSFSTYTEAVSAFGSTVANGNLIKMISQAFLNGANTVKAIVAASSGVPSDLAYSQALDLALREEDIDYVVIEGTSSTAHGYLKTHLQSCVVENKFRRGYVGMPIGTSVANIASRAITLGYDRIYVCGPNFLDNTGAVMSGGVTAASLAAGIETNTDPALPRTGLIIQGTSGIEIKMLASEYDTLHNAGVLTTKSSNSEIGVMRFLTTDISANGIKEGTIGLQRDYVAKNLKNQLETEFKQSKVISSTLAQIKASVLGRMKEWQAKAYINPDYPVVVNVTQDVNDKTKVIADVGYTAVYPLNFIELKLTLNI